MENAELTPPPPVAFHEKLDTPKLDKTDTMKESSI